MNLLGKKIDTAPRRFRHWVKVALRLITRRAKKNDQVDQHMGKTVRIKIDGKDNYQLDGDVVGESTNLFPEIQPGALAICVQPKPPLRRTNDPTPHG